MRKVTKILVKAVSSGLTLFCFMACIGGLLLDEEYALIGTERASYSDENYQSKDADDSLGIQTFSGKNVSVDMGTAENENTENEDEIADVSFTDVDFYVQESFENVDRDALITASETLGHPFVITEEDNTIELNLPISNPGENTNSAENVKSDENIGKEQNGSADKNAKSDGKSEAGISETASGDAIKADSENTYIGQDTSYLDADSYLSLWKKNHTKVHGIYVTANIAGSSEMQNYINLCDTSDINTIVIDVKDDSGHVTFDMDVDIVKEYGLSSNAISDIEGLMTALKQHGIYTIARIVCFKDPALGNIFPELKLKTAGGSNVYDENGTGWVNPYKTEVWNYLVDISRAAAEVGFDEIQYDYVRFPVGGNASNADYGVSLVGYPKTKAIDNFIEYATAELHNVNVAVGADLFGSVIDSEKNGENIGQSYMELSEVIDVLSPMVYPSHYGSGSYGLSIPDAYPYELVYNSMITSKSVLSTNDISRSVVVRPYLQCFTASWVSGHINYGVKQINAQIQAVYDAGYEEWILWNGAGNYSAAGYSW